MLELIQEQPRLLLQGVSKTFAVRAGFMRYRKLTAVDDVSLTIAKGDILGVVGESGSGKTTLSKLMLGMVQPTTGAIAIDGVALAKYSRLELARRIQFVFQDPFSSLNPQRRVSDIIAQPLRIHRRGEDRLSRVRALLELVGLPARVMDAFPGQLSGGQRQRVVIARALALEPRLLVCDEPTSALDVSVQAQILNLLLDLKQQLDLTLVLVSHNLSVIQHLATKVAVMYLGRIVEMGSAEQVFSASRHPYTKVLLGSTMTVAPGKGIPPLRLGGPIPSPTAIPQGCRFHTRCPEAQPVCAAAAPLCDRSTSSFSECHFGRSL